MTAAARRGRAPLAAAAVAALALALVALAPSPADAGLFSSGRSSSSYRPSSSSSYFSKPVSSGYGYKPSYKTTSTFSAPKPGASAPFGSAGYASPSNFGNSFLGGRPGAASYGSSKPPTMPVKPYGSAGGSYRPSKPSKMTSLAVPFAVGAGAGALTSAAFRSGQRSCGDGRLECFESPCDRARMQCAPARDAGRLRRVRCPSGLGFSECWAAGGGERLSDGRLDEGDAPTFICMGKARPRSNGDVVAQCFDYNAASKSRRSGAADGDDRPLTAGDVLAGDPALPTSRAMGYDGQQTYYNGAGGVGGARVVMVGVVAAAVALAAAAV